MNNDYLQETFYIDHSHPAIAEFVAQYDRGGSELERAVAVYYGVRDAIRYDPFSVSEQRDSFKASEVIAAGRAWCVPKAVLLAACYRHMGIPARLGFADVTNHLSTEKLRLAMQSDVFMWHGYTSVWLEEQWVKATPAFNLELCEKFNLKPLEFNGRDDSIYHEFDRAGNRHMEYLKERGEFADLPYEQLFEDFRAFYPQMFNTPQEAVDFDAEVERETGNQS